MREGLPSDYEQKSLCSVSGDMMAVYGQRGGRPAGRHNFSGGIQYRGPGRAGPGREGAVGRGAPTASTSWVHPAPHILPNNYTGV